ncbi:hypothetical protein F4561_004243 [Lipingzhangella halophila]|uniref:Sulfotransferase family protein n=1 Tax=Lipingzhangella halophila TaxID=1783352 RepID=A0A7W7RK00_9ACTN|nr:hypothetical protein [Lipingzhangella halophila]MBB4933423.1 hypothetical protein [Lipingzhangella halophila]
MATRLVLHIGVQKSGTTYLQHMLRERVDELTGIGVDYPLPPTGPRPVGRNYHEFATYGLLGTEYPWVGQDQAAAERGSWERLLGQVNAAPGTSIVSPEALSVVRTDAAREIVDALGVDDIQVVITARHLGKLLPSVWQQHLRNGHAMGFGSYLERLARIRDRGWPEIEKDHEAHLWRAFALGRLAHRWAGIVGAERVTLVANPGSPADLLWHRFLEAIGLGDATEHLSPPDTTTTVHSGVTAAEASVLRSVNTRLGATDWPRGVKGNLRQHLIGAFAERDSRGPRLAIPPRYREQVAQWSADDVADLRESGVRVVGDIDELCFTGAREPEEPTSTEVADAAGTAAVAAATWSDPNTPTTSEAPEPAGAQAHSRGRTWFGGRGRR